MGIVSELTLAKIQVNNSVIKQRAKSDEKVADLLTQSIQEQKERIDQQAAKALSRSSSVDILV